MHTITLDWLAMTFKEYNHETERFLSDYALFGASDTTKPTNGYREARTGTYGVVHMWNPDREEMGHHVIFSGSALRDLFSSSGISQQTLLAEAVQSRGRITRLDLACDTQELPISLDAIYQALERGECSGTARSFSQIHSLNGGNTIYVGSRQSEKFVRIYDKAAQQKISNEHWKRLELETKGMVARAIASVLVQAEQWSAIFRTAITAMVDIPSSRDFRALLPSDDAKIGIPKLEKKTDREKWIDTQVTPAVVQHFQDNRDSAAVAKLRLLLDLIEKSE